VAVAVAAVEVEVADNDYVCVPKIRFCNIGDEVRRGQAVM